MIAAFSLYVDFWYGVGSMPGKVAHDHRLVKIFTLCSVVWSGIGTRIALRTLGSARFPPTTVITTGHSLPPLMSLT